MEEADRSPMTPIQRKCAHLVYAVVGILFLIFAGAHHVKKLFNDKKGDQVPPTAIKDQRKRAPAPILPSYFPQ